VHSAYNEGVWGMFPEIPHMDAQMLIPEYLIYEEFKQRQEQEREWAPEPLHLPLYAPETVEPDFNQESVDEFNIDRGVVIIDMNSVDEID